MKTLTLLKILFAFVIFPFQIRRVLSDVREYILTLDYLTDNLV